MDNWGDDDDRPDEEEVRDVSFGGKDALIFLIDATADMHKAQALNASNDSSKRDSTSDFETPFNMAVRCVHATIRSKIFNAPSDLVGVLLYGTEKHEGVSEFEHISMLLPLEVPQASSILSLEKITSGSEIMDWGSSSKFSLHEALWQCQSMFSSVSGKTNERKIVLLTCGDDPHSADVQRRRQAMQKARDLHETGIYLDVLPIGSHFKMDKFFVDLIKLADDEAVDAADPVQSLEDLLRVVRKRVHKKRSLGRITFDLGNDVKIAVSTYNLVQKAYKPSKVKLALDTNEEVRTQRTFVNPTSGAPLLPSDISKYQEYGGKKIKFTQDETNCITLMDGDVGLQLCGFKPRSLLKWGQFVRSGYFIYPEENVIKGSRQLFAALLIKCLEREVVAVCAYKPRHNSGPSFVALVPQAEERDADGVQINPSGFHLQFLPFADDVRQVPDVALKEMAPEQVEAAEQIVRKLRMKNYRPEMFENPDLQAHYALIEALALQRDDVKLGEDLTLPQNESIKEKLHKVGPLFLAEVYPTDYDPNATSKPKRKAEVEPKKEPKERAKKPKVDVNEDNIDMGTHVENNTVNKLTVAELKSYLASIERKIPSTMKKADLVEEVYKYYGKR